MAGVIAKGGTIKKGVTSIAQIKNWSLNPTMEVTDITTLDSTAREFLATIPNSGDVTFTILYDSATTPHQAFATDLGDGSSDAYTVEMSNGDTFGFNAIVTGMEVISEDVGGHMLANCTMKINGAITYPS